MSKREKEKIFGNETKNTHILNTLQIQWSVNKKERKREREWSDATSEHNTEHFG